MTDKQAEIQQDTLRKRTSNLARYALASTKISEPAERFLSKVLDATEELTADIDTATVGFHPARHAPVFVAGVRTLLNAVRVSLEMGLESKTDEFVTAEIESIEKNLKEFE